MTSEPNKLSREIIKYAIVLAILAAVGWAVYWLLTSEPNVEESAAPEEVPVNVVVQEVTAGPLPDTILLPASVEPFKELTVSAEVSGNVEWIGVEEGQRVVEGTPIARIDTRTLKADLDRAKSGHDLALANFRRSEKLFGQKAISELEYDLKKSQLEVCKAVVESARIRFEKGNITAPCSGILNRRHVELGEYVNSADPVADIVQVDRVHVVVDVPEMDVGYVEVGGIMAVLTKEALGEDSGVSAVPDGFREAARRFMPEGFKLSVGAVTYRSVVADPATRTYRVEVTLGNSDLALLPGRIVRVVILRRIIEDAVTVPLRAVIPREGRRIVFVVEGSRAREVEVGLGVTNGTDVQITSGLSAGDMLVVEGHRQLREAQLVAIREPVR